MIYQIEPKLYQNHFANFFVPATHSITPRVTAIIPILTFSCSNQDANAKPKNGCNNCIWPTDAVPPCAKPLYQKIKAINMLNMDT